MCQGKPEKLTKIEKLIEAIDRLTAQMSSSRAGGQYSQQYQQYYQPSASDVAKDLKAQVDRLEKLIG